MKGIYLTQQGKKYIEFEITLLEFNLEELPGFQVVGKNLINAEINLYKKILSSAIILPDEKNLNDLPLSVLEGKQNLNDYYPNGVIIKK